MRNRSVVFVILGLTACLCWAIGTAVADNQPGTKVTQTGTDGVAQPQSAKPMSGATAIPAGNAEMSFQKVSAALPAPRGDASGRSIKPLLPIDVSDLPPGTPGEPQPRTNCAAGTTVGVTGVNWPAVPPTGNMVFCSDMVGGYWTGAGASMAGNEWVFDDIELAGTDREVNAITFLPYSHTTGVTFPYQVRLTLFSVPSQTTICPLNDPNSRVLGVSSWATMTARWQFATVTFDPPVQVPDLDPTQPPPGNFVDFVIGFQHNLPVGSNIGLLSTSCPPIPVEMGFSNDLYSDETCTNWYFGGCVSPNVNEGNFLWRIYATTQVGACCHRDSGTCTAGVTVPSCSGPFDVFYPNKLCTEITCTASKGSCCTTGTAPPGTCSINVNIATCLGPTGNNGNKYVEGGTCSPDPFTPDCGTGACCDTVTLACTDNVPSASCSGANKLWKWNQVCTQLIGCHAVPANDLCANASALSGTCLSLDFYNENATATEYMTETLPCLVSGTTNIPIANDIWYKYQIPTTYNGTTVTSGKVIINTLGSYFDTVLAIYGKYDAGNHAFAGAACGAAGAVTCADVSNANLIFITTGVAEQTCNDDIVSSSDTTANHDPIQASYVVVSADGYYGPPPGGCLLIRVGGLNQEGNPPGGTGKLSIDFIPTLPDPFGSGEGICCLADGTGCVVKASSFDCYASGVGVGYWRSQTDFYERAGAPEQSAPGCCHGEFGGCASGQYCAKAIQVPTLDPNTLQYNGPISHVTYFKFTPRDFRPGDPGYGTLDARYALTIDTCGSSFDTILSVYRADNPLPPGLPFTESGDCADRESTTTTAYLLKRSDNCTSTEAGVEGKITDPNCIGASVTTSCMCVTVGAGGILAQNVEYYIGVGMKDTRTGVTFTPRKEGIDPVPNYPKDPAETLKMTIRETYAECESCNRSCACKGDMNGDNKVDGADIQSFISTLVSVPSCTTLAWCRADMNSSGTITMADLPAFVNALLFNYGCTPAPRDCTNTTKNYCQLPDAAPAGEGCFGSVGSGSDAPWQVLSEENFSSSTGGLVSEVCWWGFFINGSDAACDKGDTFNITYYNDNAGQPGTLKAGPFAVTATRTNVGTITVGGVAIPHYQFAASHGSVLIARDECVWIEIANSAIASGCYFYWTTVPPGDGHSRQGVDVNDYDLAFCVNIPIYVNGCGTVACTVDCTGGTNYENEKPCNDPNYVQLNPGCFGPGGNGAETIVPAFGVGTQIICGNSGVHTGEAACVDANDCPAPETCSGGFCTGGPYLLKDVDWYQIHLNQSSYIRPQFNVEFPAVIIMYIDLPAAGNCNDPNWQGLAYIFDGPTCSSGTCGPWTLNGSGGSENVWAAGDYWLYVMPNSFYVPCASDYKITLDIVAP